MEVAPAAFRQPPPGIGYELLGLGEWTHCTLDHTRIGPVWMEAPAAPFHHLSLPLGRAPRMQMRVDGRRHRPAFNPGEIQIIAAGESGTGGWDDPFESACFYFTPAALDAAVGLEGGEASRELHTTFGLHDPVAAHLMRALLADAQAGQPHGRLVGDAIFTALAAQLAPARLMARRDGPGPAAPDWRVRRAQDYIHDHLSGPLDLAAIAAAAGTSPFHLSRCFRAATGRSIWRYVLGERARLARSLMRDPALTLTDVAEASGFESYSSFVAAVRREFGLTPKALRRAARSV